MSCLRHSHFTSSPPFLPIKRKQGDEDSFADGDHPVMFIEADIMIGMCGGVSGLPIMAHPPSTLVPPAVEQPFSLCFPCHARNNAADPTSPDAVACRSSELTFDAFVTRIVEHNKYNTLSNQHQANNATLIRNFPPGPPHPLVHTCRRNESLSCHATHPLGIPARIMIEPPPAQVRWRGELPSRWHQARLQRHGQRAPLPRVPP